MCIKLLSCAITDMSRESMCSVYISLVYLEAVCKKSSISLFSSTLKINYHIILYLTHVTILKCYTDQDCSL